MYNTTNSGNTTHHNGTTRSNTGNKNAPRYREASRSDRGGRGRDSQKKPTNVWAPRTPSSSTTPENDFMSKFGITEQSANGSAAQRPDETEVIAQKLSNTSLQDKQQKTEHTAKGDSAHTTNGHGEHDGQDRAKKAPKAPKDPSKKQTDLKAKQPSKAQTRLSLAEFYHSVPSNQEEGMSDETPSRVLWVGNIGPEVTEEELSQEFGQFGKIESIRILHNRYCAFVNFEDEEAAKTAKQALHNTIVGSQYIVIHYRQQMQPDQTKSTESNFVLNNPSPALWIGNVSEQVTEDELRAEFEQFGKIDSIRLIRPKTCAFVNFSNVEEASNALQTLQGKKLGNMAIKINFGKPFVPPTKGQMDQMQSQYLSSTQYLSEYQYGMPNGMQMPPMMIPAQYLAMMEPYQYYDQPYDPAIYEQMGYMPAPYGYGYIPAYPPMYPGAEQYAAMPQPTGTNYELMQ